ncbi:MAG: rod shape-determining protein, partial [Pseudobdellovibrionaceae bacterium]
LIDIGGGTTEVAIIALSDIIYCEPLKMGGHKLDDLIISYVKKNKKLVISEALAEELKFQLGTAVPKKDIFEREITGRNLNTGLTQSIMITSEEIGMALNDGIEDIINAIHRAIEHTPPEIVSDIIESGIVLTGGGALIRDIALRIKNEVRLNVHVTDDPLLSIARGGEKLLGDAD